MRLDVTLCNHAEAVNNLLYVAGGGVNVVYVPPGAPPPYGVTVGIGMLVTVPWLMTNQQHKIEITLLGEDGQPVQLPVAHEASEPLSVVLAFNVGRPTDLPSGDDQIIALATNLVNLPMPAMGRYEFALSVNGNPERRLGFRLQQLPGGQMAFRPSVR
jgi:hypothetical protein